MVCTVLRATILREGRGRIHGLRPRAVVAEAGTRAHRVLQLGLYHLHACAAADLAASVAVAPPCFHRTLPSAPPRLLAILHILRRGDYNTSITYDTEAVDYTILYYYVV